MKNQPKIAKNNILSLLFLFFSHERIPSSQYYRSKSYLQVKSYYNI